MRYEAPDTISAVVALLNNSPARGQILSGGTDLIVQMRAGTVSPALLIDIKNIPETRAISQVDGCFIVGAAVSGAEITEHEEFKTLWPGVSEAMDLIGSTQIQGRASLGGNLCNGSPAADAVPAMIAAAATCLIVGPVGEREVPVENIVIAPGEISLSPGEFVVSFKFPKRQKRSGDAYLRLIPRTEMDIAVVGAGVCLSLDDAGQCTAARVSLAAVAPNPLLVEQAANAIIGSSLDQQAMENLVIAVQSVCNPIDDKRGTIEYRTKVAGVLASRSARIAYDRASKSSN